MQTLPSSGAGGQQFLVLQVTNSGSSPCTVGGAPGLALQLAGGGLGKPVEPVASGQTVTLAGAGTAAAQVSAPSTCNASVSDTVVVRMLGQGGTLSAAGQLRACDGLHISAWSNA